MASVRIAFHARRIPKAFFAVPAKPKAVEARRSLARSTPRLLRASPPKPNALTSLKWSKTDAAA